MTMALMNGGLNVLSCVDSTTLLVFVITFLTVTLFFQTRRDKRVPPGPPLIPIIGNLLSTASKDPLENFASLRKKYGDIFGLYIGGELTVFLNSYEAIYDAFLKKGSLFSRRPMTPFTVMIDVYTGVIVANDKLWKEQRSFTQRALQQLCFKNKSEHIEQIILKEARKLLDKLEEIKLPLNPKQYLSTSTANVISSVIWSKSFDLDDPDFSGFLREMAESSLSLVRKMVLVNCFPFLLKLPFDILDLKTVFRGPLKWHKSLEKHLQNRERSSEKSNDFIDLYLAAITENDTNNLGQTYTIPQLMYTTFDLLIAGSDTTATAISWLLLYILHNPEVETRLQSEIDAVIGPNRTPSLTDRPKMPFMEATIMEGLRIAPPAALAVPHSVQNDVTYKGYLIRKDISVVANLFSVFRDPKLWEEPDKFHPERFLTKDQKSVETPKFFFPFSLGPRSCLGETLSRMELFLYMTSLLQKFRLVPADADNLPEIKGVLGVVYYPQPYMIRFVKR